MEHFYRRITDIASRYDTDDIFIIGKGPSADEIDPRVYTNGAVINLNDSERIAKGDFCLFFAPWVIESLTQVGFNDELYISNLDLPDGVRSVKVEHVPLSQESSELMYQRFTEESFVIEGVLLISALKLARLIANHRMKRQKVYLVGFDFNMGRGYSKRIDVDYSRDERTYQSNVVSAQEHYFLMFSYLLRDSNLLINHVGNKSYSKLTCGEMNRRFVGNVTLNDEEVPAKIIGKTNAPYHLDSEKERVLGERVLVTAEITTNHFGDLSRLEKMIRRAHEAGADLVKLQKRDVETFYRPEQLNSSYESPFGRTFRDYRNALELNEEAFWFVDKLCKELAIDWFVSILDMASYRFMQQFERPILKLPSTISQHKQLIEAVAREFDGAVVISTGFTDQTYEEYVLDTFKRNREIYMLQCTSAYPTPPDDCNVAVVRHYHELSRKVKNLRPGYSSHDYGSLGCMLAVAAGAKMLEKHVKYGDTEWAHFDAVALDLSNAEFSDFVADVRLAERITGSEIKVPSDIEHHKYWVR